VEGNNFDIVFSEKKKKKSQLSKLNFDMIHAFILRGPEYYADIQEIHDSFPFDLMIADCAFTGIPFVKDRMNIPVISIGVFPLVETSKDLPPSGLGITPSNTRLGKIRQTVLRFLEDKILFGKPNRVMRKMLNELRSHTMVKIFST
jgi:hypothetical protein